MARIMAIDYGKVRTGLAVTDPLQIIASALETVSTESLLEYLAKYFKTEPVELLVIGEPLHHDGNATYLETEIQTFITKITKDFPLLKIARQDERYTSKEAKKVILQSGVNRTKRKDKSLVDRISATIILQEYMETNRW